MLRDDIIKAVKAGRFYIYGVRTINEALTLMTGLPIDTLNKKGRYHKDTLFGKILRRLISWDESQAADELIEDKKSDKKAKKKRKAKRQKKADKRRDELSEKRDRDNNSSSQANDDLAYNDNVDSDERGS